MVEVYHPEKTFEMLFGLRAFALEVSDGCDAVSERFDAACRDVVSETGEAFHAKLTLGGVEKHTVVGESARLLQGIGRLTFVRFELVVRISSM